MLRRFHLFAVAAPLAVIATAAVVAEASPSGPQLGSPLPSKKEASKTPHGVWNVVEGGKLQFTVKTGAGPGDVYVVVSKSQKSGPDGLADPVYLRKMHPVSGGRFELTAEQYPALSSYWLNRHGTYYWTAFRVNCDELQSNDGHCAIRSGEVRPLPVVPKAGA